MANKFTKEKAQAIAAAYCVNGFYKIPALIQAGCSPGYANGRGLKLFDKAWVKDAITVIMERNAAKVDVEIGEIVQGLRKIAFPPEGVHCNNSDIIRALFHLGNYKGMFKEATASEMPQIPDLTPEQREAAETELRALKRRKALGLDNKATG